MESYWSGKKVLVTGATGFIGFNLVKELITQKAEIFCIVRGIKKDNPFYKEGFDKKVTLITGDILDINLINNLINKNNIDTIFHLASKTLVKFGLDKPYETINTNIMGTLNILEGCRLKGSVKRIIIASTDKAHTNGFNPSHTGNFNLFGESPYEVSKACSDSIAKSYAKTYRLPVAIIRSCNVYGGADLNFDRIIPETIRNLLFKKSVIIKGGGDSKREFLYIKDVINGYLCLAESVERLNIQGDIFNLGTGKQTRVIDLVNKIVDISGLKEVKIKILKPKKLEIPRKLISYQKAKKILNWEPKYDLQDGLKETYEWYRTFLNT